MAEDGGVRGVKADRPPPAQHFWSKVKVMNGCWEWQAGRDRHGYGRFSLGGRDQLAHRAAWILANGWIPGDLCVLHHCDNPPCVNPDHLFLGTQAENLADMDAKGRRNNYVTPKKTHCPKGHPYAGDNLYIRPAGGSQECRRCKRENMRRFMRRHAQARQ